MTLRRKKINKSKDVEGSGRVGVGWEGWGVKKLFGRIICSVWRGSNCKQTYGVFSSVVDLFISKACSDLQQNSSLFLYS